MAIAIKVENLGKKYKIRHVKKTDNYETLRDTLIKGTKNITKKIIHPFSGKEIDFQTQEEFWALKDINLEINQGDKVGILGNNGAGKSTLLKVLSRITEPTNGKISFNGRIASLLEVGTGFHPELTGYENIFLNGAVLGMSRNEIKSKLDEIVDFSGVDKFIDTPVKRYSSGMYVRLAFSVAAHLDTEILVVDEVLAVGDRKFQKKCLAKMDDVAKNGRTILFVSHNLGAISSLTEKCILLSDGELIVSDTTEKVVRKYLQTTSDPIGQTLKKITYNRDNFKLTDFKFELDSLKSDFNQPIKFILKIETEEIFNNLSFGFGIVNSINSRIMTLEKTIDHLAKGKNSLLFTLSEHRLPPGIYSITFSVSIQNESIVYMDNICPMNISDLNFKNDYLILKRDVIGVFQTPSVQIEREV